MKLESRSELCLFVGYPKGTKGYIFYSPSDNKTFVSTNARFLEEDYIKNMKPRSRLIIEELLGEKSSISQEERVPRPIVEETPNAAEPSVPRRSGRIVRQLKKYGLYNAEGQTYIAIVNAGDDDPVSYSKAMATSDANLWQNVMDTEIQSMYSNVV